MQRLREWRLDWRGVGLAAGLGFSFLCATALRGQDSPPPVPAASASEVQASPAPPQGATPPAANDASKSNNTNAGTSVAEVTTHDTPATFKVRVNEVLVRVVVRDGSGQIVADLKRGGFHPS